MSRRYGHLIYLACPYSDPDPAVMEDRFNRVNIVAAYLMGQGLHVYSPISHTHPIAKVGELPRGWGYWKDYDTAMISRCNEIYVLKLDGWTESKGVAAELKIADDWGVPVRYLDPDPTKMLSWIKEMKNGD